MKLGKGKHWWSFTVILAMAGFATFDYNVMGMMLCIMLLAATGLQVASDDLIDSQRSIIDFQRRYISQLEGRVNGRDR